MHDTIYQFSSYVVQNHVAFDVVQKVASNQLQFVMPLIQVQII